VILKISERIKAAGNKINPKIMKGNVKPKLDVKNLKSPITGKTNSVLK
jgi:hypothetical protein